MKTNVACKQCVQKDDARGYKTTHTNSGLLLWLILSHLNKENEYE